MSPTFVYFYPSQSFLCSLCDRCFPSNNARKKHKRKNHKQLLEGKKLATFLEVINDYALFSQAKSEALQLIF